MSLMLPHKYCHFITLIILHGLGFSSLKNEATCMIEDVESCKNSSFGGPRYLFYDVNHPEGFNLRRDVYMRIAIFISKHHGNHWKLVLPPWPHLYHWRSKSCEQDQLPWSNFFDITSLKEFAPVIEMHEFFLENVINPFSLDDVFVLQYYLDAFSNDDWKWEDKWSFENCNHKLEYDKNGEIYSGWFWGYPNISSKNVRCVSFQGGASTLGDLLQNTDARYVMLDRAEKVLHDRFGDKVYWECRKSMKFAAPLEREADFFMKTHLNTSDLPASTELGGPYMCVHLRRRDFIDGRPDEVPNIDQAAKQIHAKLTSLKLYTVFIATDAPLEEKSQLKQLLSNYNVVHYSADRMTLMKNKDGGIAIIEQIICSFARYFIGTHESTFSFRIQEEREILGFPENSTFNRLCGANTDCIQPSRWKIQL